MSKTKLERIPSYRLHQQSGQARVRLNGKDFMLGKFGSAESRAAYKDRIADWLHNGGAVASDDGTLTVNKLLSKFLVYAKSYYSRDEFYNFSMIAKQLRLHYGDLPAEELGPIRLEALQEVLMHPHDLESKGVIKVVPGWCRQTINKQIGRAKFIFKWGVRRQLLKPAVHQALTAVPGLKAGRCEARESDPVKPADDESVQACLAHCSRVIAAMIQIQRLSGARPGEICSMRIGDIDRAGALGQPGQTWSYKPRHHKTAHHLITRIIYFGPKCQTVLRPFLLKIDPKAFVFSPAEAMAEMRQLRARRRATPAGYGNFAGSNRKAAPKRLPGDNYSVDAYRRAITRACDLADAWVKGGKVVANDERIVARWHPHQLRHSAATEIRRRFGLEAAQHVLGHTTTDMTEIYAEKNADIAKAVAAAIG